MYLQVYPHGSTDSLPFATMGSGSLNAMAVFESGYRDDMSKEQAMALVSRAIQFGMRSLHCSVLDSLGTICSIYKPSDAAYHATCMLSAVKVHLYCPQHLHF
jgi:20S proteasome alpha/beta subunit